MRIEVKREEFGKVVYRLPGKCLLKPSAAVLPPELEGVLDNPLDQLEGLLDLGLSQRSEVHHPHIHLRTPRGDEMKKHTHRHRQQCYSQTWRPFSQATPTQVRGRNGMETSTRDTVYMSEEKQRVGRGGGG